MSKVEAKDIDYGLTAERLKRHVVYCPETGVFKRIDGRKKTGWVSSRGYLQIGIGGRRYLAHRLAWLYVHGEWPSALIDHINMNKADNRIENLRAATKKQNCENSAMKASNKSGFRGVYFHKSTGKWCACIRHNNKQVHLGLYTDLTVAAEVAKAARERIFTHV